METTSGEEVFSFIAAAAAVTGNDDHQMVGRVQDINEPATKKQRNHPESHRTEAEVSKKELELLTRYLQSIHSSCGHCSNDTLVRALRRKGAKPLIIKLARDFVCPSCQEIQNQRPHQVASLEAIPPKWQSIQTDQAEWSHPSDNLKFKLSVIIDEGCHLKVAKMLFSHDKQRSTSEPWTSIWNSGCAILGNRREYGSTAKVLGCQKLQQCSSAKKVLCWNRFQCKPSGRPDLWRRLFVDLRPR